jgi:hypothetical protein
MLPMALASIVTVALVVASPAAAQTGAYWYAKGTRVPEGEVVPVTLKGSSSLYLASFGERVSCRTRGAGAVANSEGEGGVDEITELEFSACRLELGLAEKAYERACPRHSKLELTASGLPWSGSLEEGPLGFIEGVNLVVECSGIGAISGGEGTLVGTVGRGKLSFGVPEVGEGNFLEPDALFNGVWSIVGPPGQRAITALAPYEV